MCTLESSFAPCGAHPLGRPQPRACALGYSIAPDGAQPAKSALLRLLFLARIWVSRPSSYDLYFSLPTAFRLLPTACCQRPTAYCLLLSAYCRLLTAFEDLQVPRRAGERGLRYAASPNFPSLKAWI